MELMNIHVDKGGGQSEGGQVLVVQVCRGSLAWGVEHRERGGLEGE